MDKINYQNKLKELINTFKDKPSLLLHSCCGPCSTEVINFLKDYFTITIYYYNPNIEPEEEYLKRKKEQIKFINKFNELNPKYNIKFLDGDYDNQKYTRDIGFIKEKREGGPRCCKCYFMRLNNTALKAKELNYSYFGTTLTISPHKDSMTINKIGEEISKLVNIPFIYGDFKKNDGYKRSINFSKKYDLYRQNYCGCLYGKENL